MARTKAPPVNSITVAELETLLEQLRQRLPEELFAKVHALLKTLEWLMGVIEKKSLSLTRLRRIIFGHKSERRDRLFGKGRSGQDSPKSPSSDESQSVGKGRKRKGHGRRKASEYSGATLVPVAHDGLCVGASCPECKKGKLRALKAARWIWVMAQPMIQATLYELERFRCVLCGAVFTAQAPEHLIQGKYDSGAGVMLAISRYGMGVPMYRTEKWQSFVGVPMPASTQWKLINEAAAAPEAVYDALEIYAAQGERVQTDDTTMRIQELAKQRAEADATDGDQPKRTGCFTTGVVVNAGADKIAMFMTGANHAGENLDRLLKHRAAHLPKPLHMSDGLNRNPSKQFQTILCNCLAHGRRHFVDALQKFPEECRYVIDSLAEVYRHDAQTKEGTFSDLDRLAFHQEHSRPIMDALKKWMEEQIQQKKVEPNSGLGQAIHYMLKRWEQLTRFLEVPGAPLDNNIVERALKDAILHRKNSLSFKTLRGAKVGDVFMSLIHTCVLNGINPFDYLMALNQNAAAVIEVPTEWFPWNYHQTLASPKPPAPG